MTAICVIAAKEEMRSASKEGIDFIIVLVVVVIIVVVIIKCFQEKIYSW